jgi:hypothetical protein
MTRYLRAGRDVSAITGRDLYTGLKRRSLYLARWRSRMSTAAIVPWSQVAPERRYGIKRTPDGFRITGVDRVGVDVTMNRTCIVARAAGQSCRFGLVEYRALNRWIVNATLQGTSCPVTGDCKRSWFVEMTARVLNAKIYPLWRKMIECADPRVLAVQRRYFAASFRCIPPVLLADELYRHTHLVNDISRYPAAAIAAACVDGLSLRLSWIRERYPFAAQRQRARENWFETLGSKTPAELEPEDPRTLKLNVELLEHWPALFAPQGAPYTSLNKTLMNLPGGVTPGILGSMHEVTLERPVTDRLELITISTASQHRRRHHDHVVAHAQHREIMQAMALVSEGRNRALGNAAGCGSLSPRRTRDIAFFTRYLSDFPELHNGRIVGLAQKAVEWHRDQGAQQFRNTIEALGVERPTATPPVPPPDAKGIRFLSTVGEVGEEAQRMRHCVASYAQDAVRGLCYLFHIEHSGEMATVEVDKFGRVTQAHGPHNCHNRAASWGRQMLTAWAQTFPFIAGATQTDRDNPF